MARTDPRRPISTMQAFWSWGEYCGMCAGHREIWCPICFGFEGCWSCKHRCKVPCPLCAGGRLMPLPW
ncbi:hypothetical protein CP983_28845 [Streptomyces chartreusis]|nr:hypothetical protein CP983_28845 [Streptomyces chartreusis]